ncbi:MAG: hypothetical protein ACXVY5_00040 [Gaiellales bacterium]
MPTRLRTEKVAETITPLVTRVANDPELRDHAKTLLDSARTVYERVQADGARKAAADKHVQDEVVKAAGEIKQTAQRLTEQPRRRRGLFRKLVLGGIIAGVAAIGLKKVLSSDEDEFEYAP